MAGVWYLVAVDAGGVDNSAGADGVWRGQSEQHRIFRDFAVGNCTAGVDRVGEVGYLVGTQNAQRKIRAAIV